MTPLYHPARVRSMDERAIAAGTGALTLMERAGAALARAAIAEAGRSYGLRVALLCGKGNNGGDGLVAARRLADRGAAPAVWLTAAQEDLSPDAAAQLRRYRASGGRVAGSAAEALAGADLAVDCLLGTGAGGAPRGAVAQAIRALASAGVPVLACDVPSGVDAATGAVPGEAVRAVATLVVGAHKLGLHLWPARAHCGRLRFADIGIGSDGAAPDAMALDDADVAALLAPPAADAEKRTRGVVLLVAGSPGMAGAAVLAARGALAAGAGLVTVAAAPEVLGVVSAAVPEALTLELPGDPHDAAKVVAERAADSDAVVLGPGRGLAPEAVELARRVVRDCDRPLVLDADGLNAFRHDGAALAAHAAPLLVLTPHRRELRRLTGDAAIWDGRAERARELARQWGAVLVAKGPGTLVAAPDGDRWVNTSGGPELATGGTGDVLAGMLGTLLAQDPRAEVVAAGVHLHGRAGERAAARRGARTTGPLDVAAAVGEALRAMGAAP